MEHLIIELKSVENNDYKAMIKLLEENNHINIERAEHNTVIVRLDNYVDHVFMALCSGITNKYIDSFVVTRTDSLVCNERKDMKEYVGIIYEIIPEYIKKKHESKEDAVREFTKSHQSVVDKTLYGQGLAVGYYFNKKYGILKTVTDTEMKIFDLGNKKSLEFLSLPEPDTDLDWSYFKTLEDIMR